ncbi:MAG: SRPBCC family protein [Myxococcota bacterium]
MGSLSEFTRYASEVGGRLSNQPLQMTYTAHLGLPQSELFAYVSDTDRLHEWIPGARKTWSDDTHAEQPKQVGSVRMIDAGVGKPTQEIVKAYEAPRLIAYSATDESLFGLLTDHLGVVACEPHPSGGTVFCWLAFGRLADNRVKSWAGTRLFRFALGGGTKALKRRFPSP